MAHVLAPEAEADLDRIWYYIATESGNPDLADRFTDSIAEHFFLLSVNPCLGRRRDDLRPGVRSFAVIEYVIFYRVQEENVQILHVVRGSRNIEALFDN